MLDTVTHQHLLRAMDALVDYADAVEEALARQFRPLVDQDLTVAFYDLTTVRIHGEGKVEADIRAYGMNKETGGVARQFVLGVVQIADAHRPSRQCQRDEDTARHAAESSRPLSSLADHPCSVEKLARMTPEKENRRLSLTPAAGCRNFFSSCNDGKATSDDLHRKDWDGSSPLVGPGGSSPTVLPSRRGGIIGCR